MVPSPLVAVSAAGGLAASTVAGISFSNTIGLGSIITAAIVVIAAGAFTLRNNLKSFWKELAEERGEQVKVLEGELKAKAQDLVDAQVHHTEELAKLTAQIVALAAELKAEQSKHDLSSVTGRLETIEETLKSRTAMFDELAAGIERQNGLLREIRDRLAA